VNEEDPEEEEEEEEGLFKANAVNWEVDSERDRATQVWETGPGGGTQWTRRTPSATDRKRRMGRKSVNEEDSEEEEEREREREREREGGRERERLY